MKSRNSKEFTNALRSTTDSILKVLNTVEGRTVSVQETIMWEAADKIDALEYELNELKTLFEMCEMDARVDGLTVTVDAKTWINLRGHMI
jgi:hypothetical protein